MRTCVCGLTHVYVCTCVCGFAHTRTRGLPSWGSERGLQTMASWASWFPGTLSARLGESGGVRTTPPARPTQTDFDGGALDWLLGALTPAGGWDLPPDEDMFQHCPLSAWASRHRPVSSLSTAATVRTPAFTRPMTTGGHTPRTHPPPRCQAPSSFPRFLCPEGESGLDQGLSDPPPPFRCEFCLS